MTATPLLRFVTGRLAGLVAVLIVLSFGVFALTQLAPGDPVDALLGAQPRSPQVVAAIRAEHHLDQPFLTQYWIWLKGAVQLDFGRSVTTGADVREAVLTASGLTLQLALMGFAIVLLVGVPLGIVAALRPGSGLDRVASGVGVVGVSAPAFATSILLIYLFAIVLHWLPAYGEGRGLFGRLEHLLLPACALSLSVIALVVKVTRAAMIRELERDAVLFARARGLSRRTVVLTYALRNALVPIVTASGLVLGALISGSILVELSFSLPGVGSLLGQAVNNLDLPMIQGVTVVIGLVIVLVNLGIDLLYPLIDPRIRLGGRET